MLLCRADANIPRDLQGTLLSALFISIEGGEGVGKSLFSASLQKYLESKNIPVLKTYEPGGTPAADFLRHTFLNPPPEESFLPETELFLVSAARAQHVGKRLRPTLAQGVWILCDRYADSARVYQGVMNGLSEDLVEGVIRLSTNNLEPDITFLLDCDVGIALERMTQRGGEKSRFDAKKKEYHEELRRAFLQIAKRFPHRVHILDASQSPEKVLQDAIKIIEAKRG